MKEIVEQITVKLSVLDAECLSWQCDENFVPEQPDRFEGPDLKTKLIALKGGGSLHWYETRADMHLAKSWLEANGVECQIMSDLDTLGTDQAPHMLWIDLPLRDWEPELLKRTQK
jgi:hypothetical protein